MLDPTGAVRIVVTGASASHGIVDGMTTPAAAKRPKKPRCNHRVPRALSGGLKGSEAPLCVRPFNRDKPHAQHEATRTHQGIGTTIWRWTSGSEY